MTNAKSSKKALLMSMLSLLLCCSMLIGTTFAWFTDSVASANNIIKSGNLNIVLEYWNGEKWADVNGQSDILTNKLWEPGVTEIAYLRVANAGSLALKYQLGINIVSETAGVNVAGDSFKLSDYIQFGIVEDVNGETGAYATREAAVAALTDAKALNAGYSKAASMTAGQELYLALVVYMPTTVGNEANHNGDNVPKIELGINVFATQFENEYDSFDEKYDGGAPWITAACIDWYIEDPDATEFVLTSAEDLAGLAAIVNGTATAEMATYAANGATITIQDNFAGKTVKLASDIDLDGKEWTPIGAEKARSFSGTFDGQGYTVNNLYVNEIDDPYVGLFGYVYGGTITGVNVHNVDLTAYSNVGAIVGEVYTGSVSDCHVTGSVKIVSDYAYAGGIVGGDYVDISDCSVIADGMGEITVNQKTGAGGICGWHTEGNYQLSNCQVKNLNITAWTNLGGITGFVHYNNVIDGCSVENVILNKTRTDGHPGIGMASGGWSYNANSPITITNNTFKNITLNGTYVAVSSADILHGSEYGGNTNKNFVLANNAAENITNNMVEVTKLTDGIVENNNGTKMIYNAKGLLSLSDTKISGAYELMADIDLGGAEFKAMSAWYKTATFNGNGYTISNAKVVSGDNDNGMEQASMFFVSTNGALTVSDLTLKDITVTTKNIDNGYAAAVVGYCEGALVLNNVDVVNANVTGSKSSGMLVGHLTPAGSLVAENCDVAGSITISSFEASGHYAGEYVGTIAGNTTLNTCTANVTLGGNLKSTNVGDIYGRKIGGVLKIDGYQPINAPVVIAPAPLEEDFLFPAGTKAVLYKDVAMSGDAQITHTENVPLGLSNVTAELDHDVIVRKSAGAIFIADSNFTLSNGAKLISVGEGGDAYQVFMSNVTINGVLMNNETIWDYVDGIAYISIVTE